MSQKSRARRIGRMVRKLSGIDFTTSMKIGKTIIQSGDSGTLIMKFPQFFRLEHSDCGCCGSQVVLSGPKGMDIVRGYVITEDTVAKEVRVRKALSEVPFGTPIVVGD